MQYISSNRIAKFAYGKAQIFTSNRMQKNPSFAKLIYRLFGYTNVGNYARSKVFIRLIRRLPLSSFRNILDLGCGYGEYSFMLSEVFPSYDITALDIDKERIATVERTKELLNVHNINLFNGKIETLPQINHYDFIFSVDVFEHIYPQEMPFTECFNKLKKGGFLLVKMPNVKQKTIFPDSFFQEHQQWLDDEHVGQLYNLDDLKKRFVEAGFNIIYASYSDGFWSRLAWELSYFAKKGGSFIQLLFLPFAKLLIYLDGVFYHAKSGNAIQVIGQKP